MSQRQEQRSYKQPLPGLQLTRGLMSLVNNYQVVNYLNSLLRKLWRLYAVDRLQTIDPKTVYFLFPLVYVAFSPVCLSMWIYFILWSCISCCHINELRNVKWFVDRLSSTWCMNQHKNDLYFTKILSFGMSFSLIWLIKFLTGKRDDMCRQIVKEKPSWVEHEKSFKILSVF